MSSVVDDIYEKPVSRIVEKGLRYNAHSIKVSQKVILCKTSYQALHLGFGRKNSTLLTAQFWNIWTTNYGEKFQCNYYQKWWQLLCINGSVIKHKITKCTNTGTFGASLLQLFLMKWNTKDWSWCNSTLNSVWGMAENISLDNPT